MARSILAALAGLSSDRTVLDTAIAAARIEGGHVLALRARIDVVDAAAVLSVGFQNPAVNMGDSIARIREEETLRARHAREAYEDALGRHGIGNGGPVTLAWAETTSLFDELLVQARYHDLTVMGRDRELSPERIRTVILASGRPVLMAPPRPQLTLGKTVAIAWKEGAEAARALTAADPILAKADRILILAAPERSGAKETADAANRLAALLAAKGLKAEVHLSEKGDTPNSIRSLAYEYDADLLVMGAYAHSRMREIILGGMTETMLADCAIPVFLFH